MRFIGAALLTAAGLLAGLSGAKSMGQRAKSLGQLCRMLELMAFELERFHTPMPELFASLAQDCQGSAAALCGHMARSLEELGRRDFASLWTEALETVSVPERELLEPLGRVLGRYGAPEQLRAVESCRRELERARQSAEVRARERGRIWTGLGAAAGAAAGVLLL